MTTLTMVQSTKKDRVIYWVFTALVFLADGLPAIFSNSQPAIDGMRHMGFPDYFRIELGVCKVIGGLLLILPFIPNRIKEWVYVGFGISMLSAALGHIVLGDPASMIAMPIIFFAILLTSYIYFHKTYARGVYNY